MYCCKYIGQFKHVPMDKFFRNDLHHCAPAHRYTRSPQKLSRGVLTACHVLTSTHVTASTHRKTLASPDLHYDQWETWKREHYRVLVPCHKIGINYQKLFRYVLKMSFKYSIHERSLAAHSSKPHLKSIMSSVCEKMLKNSLSLSILFFNLKQKMWQSFR